MFQVRLTTAEDATHPRVSPPEQRTVPSASPNADFLAIAAQLRGLRQQAGDSLSLLVASASPGQSGYRLVRELGFALQNIQETPVAVIDVNSPSADRPSAKMMGEEPELVALDLSSSSPSHGSNLAQPLSSAVVSSNLVFARLEGQEPNPGAWVCSQEFAWFLSAVKRNFRYVLIARDPLERWEENSVLAQQCDGVILTVRAGRTAMAEVRRARALVARSQARLLGFIFDRNPAIARALFHR